MKSIKETIGAFALGIFAMASIAVSAADSEVHKVMIKVDRSGDNNAVVDLEVDGEAEVFTLPDLQVGETKTVTTESGKEITLTKTENGLDLIIDGKKVDLPVFKGNLGARIHRSTELHQNIEKGIHVSGVKLDDTQKQIIRDAFLAAGIDKKVSFSEGGVFVIAGSGSKNVEWIDKDNGSFEYIIKDDEGNNQEIKIKKRHVIIHEKTEESEN